MNLTPCITKRSCILSLKFILIFLLPLNCLFAQKITEQATRKFSPALNSKFATDKSDKKTSTFTVVVTDIDSFSKKINDYKEAKILGIYASVKIFIIFCPFSTLEKLIQNDLVKWIDEKQIASEELLSGFVDYSANKVSTILNRYPQFNGNNTIISIKEQLFDSTDIDFKGRILPSAYSAPSISSHASLIATIIAGGGNAWYNTKGAAWKANIMAASFSNLLPEPNSFYQTPVLTQNHSYGTAVESYYGAEAAAYDASVISNPSTAHIFSAGNSGNSSSTTGLYASINGYSNLTGNFKQAKNIITVGHTDSTGIILTPSSKGPAYDGRIKPELVAFGEDGSSGAAALVSGVAAVLHQAYRAVNNNTTASASLIKAVLLNSADDVDSPGIDFRSGYGSLNAVNALNTVVQKNYITGSVANNQQQSFTITVPSGIKKLKTTLTWTDVPAAAGAVKALVNDLDLELYHTPTSTTWLPWVLNHNPSIASLEELPVRKKDTLNSNEQITIDDPLPGNYQIVVKGSAIPQGTQAFAIAYQFDTLNRFSWQFPVSGDYLFSSNTHILRFQSTYSNNNGSLEFSTDNGTTWQNISSSVDLLKGYYKWNTPNVFSKALLCFTVNGIRHVSDTFTISRRIVPSVGFNCKDSFLLVWPKISEASGYSIASLATNYMTSFKTTTDTSLLVAKTASPAKYYNVTPLLKNNSAVPSYTFNYETQGSDCYAKSFLADITLNNNILLRFELGTSYLVKTIRFEKLSGNGFVKLNEQNFLSGLSFTYTDPTLINGTNTYRVAIVLTDGRIIYSTNATIYYALGNAVTVYPNPAVITEPVQVLSDTREEYVFELFDLTGRLVLREKLIDYPQLVNIQKLQKGFYIYRVTNNAGKKTSGKLILH